MGLKLGGYQLAAPAWLGATSAPFGWAFFAGFGIGDPFSSTPSVQFCFAKGVLNNAFPFVRSSRKYHPLRLACASSLRFRPVMIPSISTGVCTASQSCVSCGFGWKYQANLPVSGFSAQMVDVYRFAPGRA